MARWRLGVSLLLGCCFPVSLAPADEIDDALAAIAGAGPMGQGSAAARQASQRLAKQDTEILLRLLAAMDTSNIVASNWFRTAYDQIVARELAQPAPSFPVAELRDYVSDPSHQARARRLALGLLDRLEPDFRNRLVPQWLDDPEFRRDAVQAALEAGDAAQAAGDQDTARTEFRKAFVHARASEQVTQAAGKLQALGDEADIVAHLGLLVNWYLLGPFEAPAYSGFASTFPPEEAVDLQASYAGSSGPIAWKPYCTADPLGQVNLLEAIAPVKEAVGYAYCEVVSPREQPVQLRCGADDNCTVWLNGEMILSREQWLNGIRMDRFVAPATLREGVNRVLVKICQGPQHKDPEVPNNWTLQLRFCDESGTGVGLTTAVPSDAPQATN